MSSTASLTNKELLLAASAALAAWFVARIVAHTTEGWIAPVAADTAFVVAAGAVLVVLQRLATSRQVEGVERHLTEELQAAESRRPDTDDAPTKEGSGRLRAGPT